MKSHNDIIYDLQESMQMKPSAHLQSAILASVACDAPANAFPKRRIGMKTLLIAATVAILIFTTACAAVELIKSWTVSNITVNQYEEGAVWPYDDIISLFSSGVWTIDGNVLTFDYEFERFSSQDVPPTEALELAQEALGVPLLVPTHLEYGEEPIDVFSFAHSAGTTVQVMYADGYFIYEFEGKGGTDAAQLVMRKWEHFYISQTYVGDKEITLDIDNRNGDENIKTTVNGYEAIWRHFKNNIDPEYEYFGLDWVQDGNLIQLWICSKGENYDQDYIMKVAESLKPF